MRENSFENFVIDKHAEQYEGLDDEMPDDYDNWLVELDPMDIIAFAEEWGKTLQGGVK